MKTARTFAPDATSIPAARRFVLGAIGSVTAQQRDAVAVMVSELAMNAVEHARTPFQVTVEIIGGSLRVEVADSGGGTPAASRGRTRPACADAACSSSASCPTHGEPPRQQAPPRAYGSRSRSTPRRTQQLSQRAPNQRPQWTRQPARRPGRGQIRRHAHHSLGVMVTRRPPNLGCSGRSRRRSARSARGTAIACDPSGASRRLAG